MDIWVDQTPSMADSPRSPPLVAAPTSQGAVAGAAPCQGELELYRVADRQHKLPRQHLPTTHTLCPRPQGVQSRTDVSGDVRNQIGEAGRDGCGTCICVKPAVTYSKSRGIKLDIDQ